MISTPLCVFCSPKNFKLLISPICLAVWSRSMLYTHKWRCLLMEDVNISYLVPRANFKSIHIFVARVIVVCYTPSNFSLKLTFLTILPSPMLYLSCSSFCSSASASNFSLHTYAPKPYNYFFLLYCVIFLRCETSGSFF